MRLASWAACGAMAFVVAGGFPRLDAGLDADGPLGQTFFDALTDASIQYPSAPTDDPVARLNRAIEQGRASLSFEPPYGYLRSVLAALDVPVESQMAVYSKRSVQATLISRTNPRTIFFNDAVAVGWVRGGFIEIAAQDPRQGVVFYTLQQRAQATPLLRREDRCLTCHHSYATLGVPGMLLRSAFTAPDGTTLRQLGDFTSDHRSPFEQRWGGWYVTGAPDAIHHMGNAVVTDQDKPNSAVTSRTVKAPSLAGRFDADASLTPYSDIVALMVFAHQAHMTNLLTRVGWEARLGSAEHRPPGVRIDEMAAELVDYLLFVDEAPLTGPVQGASGFADRFMARGPRDRRGRSLRQLDLERRLMKYPCSYMIYTEAFNALPAEARGAIYKRMWDVLSGRATGARYARLSSADRQAILEILLDTKTDLPAYYAAVR